MADGSPKRLDPDRRKALILDAALRLLAELGLHGFSLDAVAREAGVAPSLPRHYFGSSRDLLKAATADILSTVEKTLLSRDLKLELNARFTAYLELLSQNPWAHEVWLRSAEIHPEIDAMIRKARRHMTESIFRRPWNDLSKKERLDGRGRIGYVEAIVTDWLERGQDGRDEVIELIRTAITLPELTSKVTPRR